MVVVNFTCESLDRKVEFIKLLKKNEHPYTMVNHKIIVTIHPVIFINTYQDYLDLT